MKSTLIATMRDEAPFILEWLAYHKAIGFDRVLVFSNDCTDGTDKILAALDNAGEITHIPYSPSPQQRIAEQVSDYILRNKLLQRNDWAMWLDADEFLNIHLGEGSVSELVHMIEQNGARGMCISWRVFGDGGQQQFSGKFLSPDFCQCASAGQAWQNVKTVFRFEDDVIELFQHKPILDKIFWEGGGKFLSSKPSDIKRNHHLIQHWMAGRKRGKVAPDEAGWGAAQINHYAVRTKRLFDYKKARCRIGEANQDANSRYTNTYYKGLNLNSEVDVTILRWSDRVAEGVKRLVSLIADEIDVGATVQSRYPNNTVQVEPQV